MTLTIAAFYEKARGKRSSLGLELQSITVRSRGQNQDSSLAFAMSRDVALKVRI